MDDKTLMDQCKTEVAASRQFREEIPGVVDQLVHSCSRENCFDHVGPEPIPSRDAVIDIVQRICRILYPGYFIRTRLEQFNLSYYFGQEATALFEHLSQQITVALRHDCIRHHLPVSNVKIEASGLRSTSWGGFPPCARCWLPMCARPMKAIRRPRATTK